MCGQVGATEHNVLAFSLLRVENSDALNGVSHVENLKGCLMIRLNIVRIVWGRFWLVTIWMNNKRFCCLSFCGKSSMMCSWIKHRLLGVVRTKHLK